MLKCILISINLIPECEHYQHLTKDIAATEGVNVSIASGIQAMIEAVQPSIQQRIKTLKSSIRLFTI